MSFLFLAAPLLFRLLPASSSSPSFSSHFPPPTQLFLASPLFLFLSLFLLPRSYSIISHPSRLLLSMPLARFRQPYDRAPSELPAYRHGYLPIDLWLTTPANTSGSRYDRGLQLRGSLRFFALAHRFWVSLSFFVVGYIIVVFRFLMTGS